MLRVWLEGPSLFATVLKFTGHSPRCLDRMFSLLLFDISRCHGCLRQHYRPILFLAPDFPAQSEDEFRDTLAIDDRLKRSEYKAHALPKCRQHACERRYVPR